MGIAIQRMFDGLANRYDFLNHFLSAGRDTLWRRKAVKTLREFLPIKSEEKSAYQILDLCGGTGDFWIEWNSQNQKIRARSALAHSGNCLDVIADFSHPMLTVAQSKLKHISIGPKKNSGAYLVKMDALNPCLKTEYFDAVICGFGMRNLDSLQKGIAAISPLIKPGGIFLTLEFFKPTSIYTWFFYHILAPIGIPFMGWFFASKREAYQYLVQSIQRFSTVDDYQKLFLQNGYSKTKVLPCDFGISHIVIAVKG